MPSRNNTRSSPIFPRSLTDHSIANLIRLSEIAERGLMLSPIPAAGYIAANRRGQVIIDYATTMSEMDFMIAALEMSDGLYRVSKLVVRTSNRLILDRLHFTLSRCTPRRENYHEMSLNVPNEDAKRIFVQFTRHDKFFEVLRDIPYVGQETADFLGKQICSGVLKRLSVSPSGLRWPQEMEDPILELLSQPQFVSLSLHHTDDFELSSNTFEELFLAWYEHPWEFVGSKCKVRTSATVAELKQRSYMEDAPGFVEEISGNTHSIECTHPALLHILQMIVKFEATHRNLIIRFKENNRGRLNSDTSNE
ncbi:hypothetical protein QR680_000171 [Steinernema hermaphroditum]|uniref:Uncharacterized protein n=1 Tax=Steinernema hermaphroditum TaxID=289476 RepID=A0AA39LD51_9BILA|nr:hypothetical protein QR680_000171 [Steinernema hermaphroditum]